MIGIQVHGLTCHLTSFMQALSKFPPDTCSHFSAVLLNVVPLKSMALPEMPRSSLLKEVSCSKPP